MFEFEGVAYPVQYANYQRNSYVPVELKAQGKLSWMKRYDDDQKGVSLIPQAVLINKGDVGIQSVQNFLVYKGNGEYRAQIPLEQNTPVIFGKGAGAYVEPGGLLNYRDYEGNLLLESVNIPALKEWAYLILLMPGTDDFFAGVQYTGGPIHLKHPKEYDLYRIPVEKSMRSWSYDGTGRIDQILLTTDNQTFVIVQGEKVQLIKSSDGQVLSSFESGVTDVETASLDPNNNLIIIGEVERGGSSSSYMKGINLTGKGGWEYRLRNPQINQPPVSGPNGHVYVIESRVLRNLENGSVRWEYPLKARGKSWLTIAKNNEVILINGKNLVVLSPQGEERISFIITEDDENFDAPPALDSEGKLYIASDKKLYVYE